jgi:NAD(P)H dehydrogenase (quinone)
MTKVLVLYYSSWGHMEQMSYAAAEGVKQAGAEAEVKRVPELVPLEVAKAAHYKLDQKAPIATVDELPNYDAIIFACGTRYGTMAAQMRNFIDQTGSLWAKGALIGKVGSAMTSSATQQRRRSRTATAAASPAPTNWPAPASKANTSRKLQPSWRGNSAYPD